MANVTVEQAALVFGVETADFKQGLSQVEKAAKSATQNILKYVAPIAGAFATGKLFGGFLQSDAINKFATSIGENVRDIDAWGEAVKHAGGTAEGFQSSVSTLARGLAEVSTIGTGRAKAALDALGISAKDASGNTRRATDVLIELAEKSQTLDKQKFFGLASKLGLDQGTIRLLQEGNKSVKEQIAILRERSITERDAEVAAEFNDVLQDLQKSIQALANVALRVLVPILSGLGTVLTTVTDTVRKNGIALRLLFAILGLFVARKLQAPFIALIQSLKITALTTKATTFSFRGLWAVLRANPLGVVLTLIGFLWDYLEDIYVWLIGGDSVIEQWFGPFEDYLAIAIQYLERFRGVFVILAGPIGVVAELIANFISNIRSGQGIIEALKNAFIDTINTIVRGVSNAFRSIVDLLPDFVLEQVGLSGWAGGQDQFDLRTLLEPSVSGALLADQDNSTEINTEIGTINVQTQATDADAIAGTIGDATRNEFARNATRQSGLMYRGS